MRIFATKAMKYYFQILFWLCNTQHIATWRSFGFRLSTIQCAKSSNLISYLNCSLSKQSRNKEDISFSMKFSKVIVSPYLDIMVTAIRRAQPDFVIVNITHFDGCQFLQNTNTFNLLQILRNEFEKFAKIPNKCPVEKNTEIHVKNLSLDPEKFPPYVPQTRFSTKVRLYEEDLKMFELIVNGSVEIKNRWKKEKVTVIA